MRAAVLLWWGAMANAAPVGREGEGVVRTVCCGEEGSGRALRTLHKLLWRKKQEENLPIKATESYKKPTEKAEIGEKIIKDAGRSVHDTLFSALLILSIVITILFLLVTIFVLMRLARSK
jgi:hypothetical protein